MFSFFRSNKKNKALVRKCYLEILEREPDEFGLNHYSNMMSTWSKPNGINKKDLIKLLKNSDEYKKIKLAKTHDKKPQYIFEGLYGIKYLIRPNSVLDNAIVRNGIFNKWLCITLKKLINTDGVIFDIGANAGLLSLPFAKMCVPAGCVYSFEPDSKVANQMKKNVKLNNFRNISIEEMALQDIPTIEKIILNINRAVQDNGLRNDGISTIEKDSTYKIAEKRVRASTIDRFVKENNIEELEFLKVDTEGSEYKVLKGGEKTIKKFHPIIFYEYQPIIGKAVHINNIKKSFIFLKKMGYKQYLKVKSKETGLIRMEGCSNNLPDGDIICLYKTNLPIRF